MNVGIFFGGMMTSDIKIEDLGDGRISIPLMMISGNMDILLDNKVECEAVSLTRYGQGGVVLQFHFGPGQRQVAIEKGMKFAPTDQ